MTGAVLVALAVLGGLGLAYGWVWLEQVVGSWFGWVIVAAIVLGAIVLGEAPAT